jgi:hypothetical protein
VRNLSVTIPLFALLFSGSPALGAEDPSGKSKIPLAEVMSIEELFDVGPPLQGSPEEHSYFIKRKFYTQENILAGQRHFISNCAHCHGKEAAGNGDRSITMEDAKPRMLTNLPWLRTRDDLRILRSIKYGVSGTSMTAFGDVTNMLQRIQIVTFIRSLSDERKYRDDLFSSLYQAFEESVLVVDEERAREYTGLEGTRKELDAAKARRAALEVALSKGKSNPGEVTEAYKKEMELVAKLSEHQRVDDLLLGLIDQLKNEKQFYESVGISYINRRLGDDVLVPYYELIEKLKGRYAFVDGKLALKWNEAEEKELQLAEKGILAKIDDEIRAFQAQKGVAMAKFPSAQRTEELSGIDRSIAALGIVKNQTVSNFEEAVRSRKVQMDSFAGFKGVK